MTHTWCDRCFPGCVEVGSIGPMLRVLVRGSEVFALSTRYEGHMGDAVVRLDRLPRPNPDPDDRTRQAHPDDADRWYAEAFDAMAQLVQPDAGLGFHWQLVEDLRAGGWNPEADPPVELWLYDTLARLVAARPGGGA